MVSQGNFSCLKEEDSTNISTATAVNSNTDSQETFYILTKTYKPKYSKTYLHSVAVLSFATITLNHTLIQYPPPPPPHQTGKWSGTTNMKVL